MTGTSFHLPTVWPAPADPPAARRFAERFSGCFSGIGATEGALAEVPGAIALMDCLGGNSPFLSDLAVRDPKILQDICSHGPDAALAEAMARLRAARIEDDRPRIASAMREAKRSVALITAVADIGRIWSLEQVTAALSTLAEQTLCLAIDHLLLAAHTAGRFTLHDPSQPSIGSGLIVLGMGKLGARELNYSSDIDLILLFDAEAGIYRDSGQGDGAASEFARIARGLVTLMQARDADGYVFRTDLRLRPDPAATPPVIALTAALTYYESMGQNWERAAMIKARPVAGDIAAGADFLAAIRPFVWRRSLDFAAVADIHAMKRRIDTHRGGALAPGDDPVARIAGHNAKLGEGGIREIEFLCQTLQLVWGGRDPGLRTPGTLTALRLLSASGRISPRAARELAQAYRFLRSVEHRLQMVDDRQTHSLPQETAALDRFAVFMGYDCARAFALALLPHLETVRRHYADVFEAVQEPTDTSGPALELSGPDDPPAETIAALGRMGFHDPDWVANAAKDWSSGRLRALRSERARELMDQMLPAILAALAAQPDPDATFRRFDAFLSGLPAGVQPLSLFQRNPELLGRIAAVLGAAPSLADHLSRHPSALDGLLSLDSAPEPDRLLRARLTDAKLLEDAIAIIRRTVRQEDFSLSVATLEGRLDADEAGSRRSALADATLSALLPRVLDDYASRYGRVRGGAMAVVLMGKAGGREMMAGSDLDLMLVYDHPEDVTESRGARRLPASQWFVRATHAFVAAVTAPGIDGPLYAVDMRLRPSGNKGPVAVSLEGFRRYHRESAWTWERMALTRARIVAGPAALRARVASAITEAMGHAGEPSRIAADAVAMRARMARDLPPDGPWDVKLRDGGQIDVEFVAQALQLIHFRPSPDQHSPTTRIALARLRDSGALAPADSAVLIRADRVWRTVQGMLRILVGRHAAETLPDASAVLLLRALAAEGFDAVDVTELRAKLDALACEVRAVFVSYLGETSL